MAIFHMSIKAGSRSKGGAQYHGRYLRRDERVKVDEHHPVTTLEFNRPKWAIDMDDFWTAADEFERKNGSVYREYEISLPIELSPAANELLVSEWVQKAFPNQVVEAGIHWKEGNPHSHIQVCERLLDGIERSRESYFKRFNAKNPERGGCRKDDRFTGNALKKLEGEAVDAYNKRRRELASNAIKTVRASWAESVNHHIVPLGIESISSLSNKERNIDKSPSVHIGRKALAMAKRGIIGDRIAEAIELEERRAYVAREANQKRSTESDERNGETIVIGAVSRIEQNAEGRPEATGKENSDSKRSSRKTNQGNNQGRKRHIAKLDNGGISNGSSHQLADCGVAPILKVHNPGFRTPAYFATGSSSRKPIAYGLENGGFTLVLGIYPTEEELVELILDASGADKCAVELFGDEAWIERSSAICIQLGIEFEIQQPQRGLHEINTEPDEKQSTRSLGV